MTVSQLIGRSLNEKVANAGQAIKKKRLAYIMNKFNQDARGSTEANTPWCHSIKASPRAINLS
jgi:hypothetical protein